MSAFDDLQSIRKGMGLTVAEFMTRAGLSRDAWYKWREDEAETIEDRSQYKLESAYPLRVVRDSDGRAVGIERVSSHDIDNETSISDFPKDTLSEQDMVGDYELIARRYQLPHWEDLDERTRADIRIEFGVAEEAAERARSAAREAILRMMRNKRE